MKTVEDIHGTSMSIATAEAVVYAARQVIPKLKAENYRRVHTDLHDEKTIYTTEALEFWESIDSIYSKWIVDNKKKNILQYILDKLFKRNQREN